MAITFVLQLVNKYERNCLRVLARSRLNYNFILSPLNAIILFIYYINEIINEGYFIFVFFCCYRLKMAKD